MKTISKPKQKTYYIAHNGKDVFHAGTVEPSNELQTGQPKLETFTDKQAWEVRCAELGITIDPNDP